MSVLSAFNLLTLPTHLTQLFAGQRQVQFFTSVPNAAEHLCDHIITHPEKRLWHALALLVDPHLSQEPFWTDHEESFMLARQFWRGDIEAALIFNRLYAFYYATAVATIEYALNKHLFCADVDTNIQRKRRSLAKKQETNKRKQWALFSPCLHKLSLNSLRVHSIYFTSAGKAENVHKSLLVGAYDLDEIIRSRQNNPLPRYEKEEQPKNLRRDQQRSAKKRSKHMQYASTREEALKMLHKHFVRKKKDVRKLLNDQFYKERRHKQETTVIDELSDLQNWQVEVNMMTDNIKTQYELITEVDHDSLD